MSNTDALKARGTRLSQPTDALNESFRKVEVALQKLGLGVRARIVMSSSVIEDGRGNGVGTETIWLTYGKLDGKWRLLLETELSDRDDIVVEPLLNASREDRVSASQRLDDLLRAMVEEVDREIAEVDDARERVDTFLQAVKP
jgi:hypothetical protein